MAFGGAFKISSICPFGGDVWACILFIMRQITAEGVLVHQENSVENGVN